MHWIDWIIIFIPLLIVVFIGFRAQRYVKGVSDFLSAGRVAGRYVVAVASGEAVLGLISLIALFEVYYNSGLAYSFWGAVATPIGLIVTLTGFCTYRYRETRAMTLGQFFGLRYGRGFRIYAGVLQATSGIINYAIFPAVGSRFLVYFCNLPIMTTFGGWEIPTFMVVMAIFLSLAVLVATLGGQITIMTTDCIQGILSYPMYAIIVIYLLTRFSWFNDIVPPLLLDRPVGKSFLNPFDIHNLRDFNIFFVVVGIFSYYIFNRMASAGGTQGYNSAAKDAHEQKMGGVLGAWRAGFSVMMFVLLGISAYAFLNGGKDAEEAAQCRSELALKAMADVTKSMGSIEVVKDFETYVATGEKSVKMEEYIGLAKQKDAARKAEIHASKVKWGLLKETPAVEGGGSVPKAAAQPDLEAAKTVGVQMLQGYSEATGSKVSSQAYKTIFGQMRVPVVLKTMLPMGIAGLFCALCVFLMISTDTTYMHTWGGIIIQDVLLPIRGKPLTPRQHLMLLRIAIISVASFAFVFSAFFAQIDFILMFMAITGLIWLGGAGSCIVGGLYWKRGTTAGAFTSLTVGSVFAVTGIVLQKTWETGLYPWLESRELVGTVAVWLEKLSSPFHPYILWEMSPTKFPINSQELYFFAMMLSIISYIVVSLLTCKESHNMERLLHRGKYHREGEEIERAAKPTFRGALNKIIGITSQYTKGDRILARSVFFYSFVWAFGFAFVGVVIWNRISPWPQAWWGTWYFITHVCILGLIGVISTVWFTWGGTRDLLRMFKALKTKEADVLDDGRVIGNVSADDVDLVEKTDHVVIEQAHVQEEILAEELKEEGDMEDLKNLHKHGK
ncbi:MAG: sodium:panthothenate symporter [Verrucomicrobiota bacterium]